MHWYLAIIYHPENVLQAPEQETAIRKSVCNTRTTRPSKTAEAPSRSTTPEKTREGDEISTPEPPPDRAIETAPPSPSDASSTKPDTLALQQQEEAMMMDEEEILRHLTDCSLQSSQGEKSPKSISRPASPAQVILDNTHMEFNLMNNPGSPTASETAVQRITGVQTTEITDDNEPIIYSFSPVPSSFANCDDTADVNLIPPVPATTFYAKAPSGLKPLRASRKGKEKAVNMTSETKNIELTEDEAGADDESSFIAPPGKPKCAIYYIHAQKSIFTVPFSLGHMYSLWIRWDLRTQKSQERWPSTCNWRHRKNWEWHSNQQARPKANKPRFFLMFAF